jgi:hypothetical protein
LAGSRKVFVFADSIAGLPTTGFPYGGIYEKRHPGPVAADFSTKMLLTMNPLPRVVILSPRFAIHRLFKNFQSAREIEKHN